MNNASALLFFDIETTARKDAGDLIQVKSPSNYKDPDKIAAYVAEKKAEQLALAALDPDLAVVRAIAWRHGVESWTTTQLANTIQEEAAAICAFWEAFAATNGRCCGYNVIAFDLPFLMRRSMELKIPLPLIPNLARYRSEPVVDLFCLLYNWNPGKGLKWVVKRYGLDNPLPELNGAGVAEMDDETVRRYVANDVYLVAQLYQRMAGVYFR